MHWSCLSLLVDGLVVNPFSTCTQPSILASEQLPGMTTASVEGCGSPEERSDLLKRPNAILSYISMGGVPSRTLERFGCSEQLYNTTNLDHT